MKTFKIGQEVTVTEDVDIKGWGNNSKIQVKKGDKGFIDSNNHVHYISGNAEGMIQLLKNFNIKGYDVENIVKLIFNQLNGYFGLQEILEENDIKVKDFKGEIECVLDEIL